MTKDKFVHIATFGCQMNEHDSERMAGLLLSDGFCPTEDIERADKYLQDEKIK